MEIYLKQGSKIFRFPVVPSSFEQESSQNNTTENVSKLGEVNLIGKRNLKSIQLESLFPKTAYGFCKYTNLLSPKESVDIIEDMKAGGAVQLIITSSKNINRMFTIDTFNWGQDDASGDINFSLEFNEYRYIKREGSSAPTNSNAAITYTCKKGDTLQKVSMSCTGTTANWEKIKKDNNLKSNNLKKGQKLTIKV